MVFFCCNKCGSSLKKAQVDKHLFQCHPQSLSCMDCHKDFRGEDYKGHTKCITEEEKYGGEGFKAPPNRNKGEKKQQAWVEMVQATVESAGKHLMPAARNLLQALTKHENVPRKKPKFMNFVRNISRNRFDQQTLDNVWDLLEKQLKKAADENKQNVEADKVKSTESYSASVDEEQSEAEKKKKKKKDKESNQVSAEVDPLSTVSENTDSLENGAAPKKKKKKDRISDESSITEAEVSVNGTTQIANVEEESVPKKKKKKSKMSEENSMTEMEVSLNDITGTTDVVQESVPKKKKKKSKKNPEDINEVVDTEDGITENSVLTESHDVPEDGMKKSKKNKKSKDTNSINVTEPMSELGTTVENTTTEDDSERRKKKKKRRRSWDQGPADVEVENGIVDEDQDLPQKKKHRNSKTSNSNSSEANGLSIAETNKSNNYTPKSDEKFNFVETPEDLKARLKAERKAARKAAKGIHNGHAET